MAGAATEAQGSVWLMGKLSDRGRQEFLGAVCMAERTIRRWCVVKLMARQAALFVYGLCGTLMAEITSESHLEMWIVEEASGGEGKRVSGRSRVTDPASFG